MGLGRMKRSTPCLMCLACGILEVHSAFAVPFLATALLESWAFGVVIHTYWLRFDHFPRATTRICTSVYTPSRILKVSNSAFVPSSHRAPITSFSRLRFSSPLTLFRSESLSLELTKRPKSNEQGTVDYIFYGSGVFPKEEPGTGFGPEGCGKSVGDGERSDCLRCVGVAEPPLRRDLDRYGGLPSPEEPSDHILLAARFEVKLRC